MKKACLVFSVNSRVRHKEITYRSNFLWVIPQTLVSFILHSKSIPLSWANLICKIVSVVCFLRHFWVHTLVSIWQARLCYTVSCNCFFKEALASCFCCQIVLVCIWVRGCSLPYSGLSDCYSHNTHACRTAFLASGARIWTGHPELLSSRAYLGTRLLPAIQWVERLLLSQYARSSRCFLASGAGFWTRHPESKPDTRANEDNMPPNCRDVDKIAESRRTSPCASSIRNLGRTPRVSASNADDTQEGVNDACALPDRPPQKFLPSQPQVLALLSMAVIQEERGSFRERFGLAASLDQRGSHRERFSRICNIPISWFRVSATVALVDPWVPTWCPFFFPPK